MPIKRKEVRLRSPHSYYVKDVVGNTCMMTFSAPDLVTIWTNEKDKYGGPHVMLRRADLQKLALKCDKFLEWAQVFQEELDGRDTIKCPMCQGSGYMIQKTYVSRCMPCEGTKRILKEDIQAELKPGRDKWYRRSYGDDAAWKYRKALMAELGLDVPEEKKEMPKFTEEELQLKKKVEEQERKIINEVKDHMKWPEEKAILWYKTDNPNFGGTSPMKLVRCGRGHKVIQFIEAAKEGLGP